VVSSKRIRVGTDAGGPESFFVSGMPGPPEDGELERAAAWGQNLANEVMTAAA
jgi:hypothetical protein